MRIVLPVHDLNIGGGPKMLCFLANTLAEMGHDIEVVMPQIGTVEYPLKPKLTRVPLLAKQYIPDGDIILTNYYLNALIAYDAWPSKCVRLSLGWEPLLVSDARALESYKLSAPIICNSTWVDDLLYENTGKRGVVINNGIDLNIFYAKKRNQKREGDFKKILYLARRPEFFYKGYDDFIAAIRIVQQTRNDIMVIFISPDSIAYPSDIVHFSISPKDDEEMAFFYQEADVFVSTSWYEGFPLPPLEAMSCGIPVVTTDSGGIRDYCNDENSIIVPPKNSYKIAEGIMNVLNHRDLTEERVGRGLKETRGFSCTMYAQRIAIELERIHLSRE